MAIYTRTGDKGETSLANGSRVSKNHNLITFVGHLDEINAHLGICNSYLHSDEKFIEEVNFLRKIQNDLFVIGSISVFANLNFDVSREVLVLEKQIDRYDEILPKLTNFILPGGNQISSYVHLLRTSVRKLEIQTINSNEEVLLQFLPYLNRLSDFLFVLARYINFKTNSDEVKWIPLK